MAKRIVAKKRLLRVLRNIPFALYVLFVAALLGLTIYLSSLIIGKLYVCNDDNQYGQLIIGLVASVLSFVLCLNAILGNIVTKINNKRKDGKDIKISVSAYIKDFNNNVLIDLTLVRRIIKRTEEYLQLQLKFDCSLQNQKERVEEFNNLLNANNKIFNEALLYSIATVFYTSNKLVGNMQMTNFAESVIKSNSNSSMPLKSYVKTIGGSEFLFEFRRMRIKVLNYFERMAVEYVNGLVSEELVDVQFKEILSSLIPSFYYLIYNDEGLNSYPYLNVMLQKMMH